MARPRKNKADRFSEEIRVKIRPNLKSMIQEAARAQFLDESAFIRSVLERSARNLSISA